MEEMGIAEQKIRELIDTTNKSGNFENLASDIERIIIRYHNRHEQVLYLTDHFMHADSYEFIPEVVVFMLSNYPPYKNYIEVLKSLAEECAICDSDDHTLVTLYRGSNDRSWDIEEAYSFTTDRSIAERFARGQLTPSGYPSEQAATGCKIYTVQVPERFIIGRTDDRSEKEVVVLPAAAGGEVNVLQVEELK